MTLSTKLIAFIAGSTMLIPNASSRMYLEKNFPTLQSKKMKKFSKYMTYTHG